MRAFLIVVASLVPASGFPGAVAVLAQTGEPAPAAETESSRGEPPAEEVDRWAPWRFWLGEWRGEEHGDFGEGRGERSYEMILENRFLLARNRSTFPPQEGLEQGDEHEDLAIFSYDTARDAYVLRQFVSEGFVNRLVLDPASKVPERMVFVGEASENAPPGFQTRLTLETVGDDEFVEVFELGPPGGELKVVLRNRWRRVER